MKGSVFVGMSVDGFLARGDGGLDFLSAGEGEPHGFEEFFASVDALLLGRTSYDFVHDHGQWPYGEKPVFVLTSRALPPPLPGAVVEPVSGTAKEVARLLDAKGHREVYVDGGDTVRQFLRAGLIRRLVLTRVPVLIGTGLPLFGPLERDVELRHVATRTYASGLVQSEYEVVA